MRRADELIETNNFRQWIKDVSWKTVKNIGLDCVVIVLPKNEILKYFIRNTTIKVVLRYKDTLTNTQKFIYMDLKRPIEKENELIRSVMKFHNEVMFYEIYAMSKDNFLTCYYSNWMTRNDKVIVLQNIEKYGYSTFHSVSYEVPVKRTIMVLREIARFHAKGYVMKELNKEMFFNTVKLFRENRFEQMNNAKTFFKLLVKKTKDYLRRWRKGLFINKPFICEKTEFVLSNAVQVLMKVVKTESSLSTICHGDLRLDNIFFNDDNAERPVILSNFGFVMYAPPAIDLSTYMCICCMNKQRIMNYSKYMKIYHDALTKYLQEAGIQNMENYTFEAFVDNYKKYCIAGLLIACFSLPLLIKKVTESKLNMMTETDYVEHVTKDNTDEMPKKIVEIIKYLLRFECFNILDL